MNVNIYYIKDYQIFIPLAGQKNKPNSNPIKPNLRKAKMNVNLTLTKDYRNKVDFTVRINKPNFRNGQNECNLKYNKGLWQFSDRDPKKTNPNKPNFRKAQMNVNSLITKDYRKKDAFAVRKNKPNSNPISPTPKACPELRRRG